MLVNLSAPYAQALIHQQLRADGQHAGLWQAHHSPRFSHAHIEHTYFISGPQRSQAVVAAVDTILEKLALLLRARKHLPHVLMVRTRHAS